MTKLTIAVAALTLSALALVSCGRKGPLEVPPPKNPQQQARQAEQAQKDSGETVAQFGPTNKPIVIDGSGQNLPTGPTAESSGQSSFFLDRLIN